MKDAKKGYAHVNKVSFISPPDQISPGSDDKIRSVGFVNPER